MVSYILLSLILFTRHDAIDVADPSSLQDACHMNFAIDLAHCILCSSVVEHRIPHQDSEIFLCPMHVTRRKTSFSKYLFATVPLFLVIFISAHFFFMRYRDWDAT